MKKFVLRITATAKEPESVFKLTRQFHSLSIEQNELIYNELIMELHGSKLRHLKLKKVFIQCLERLLKHTPLLEYIELSQVSLISMGPGKISLPNLKYIKLEDSSDEIFSLITDTTNLTTLEIINYENREITMKFIMQNPSINSLAIGYRNLENFFQNGDVLSVPFRLKKLDFAGFPTVVVADEECLKKFLKLHAQTLEEIRLPHIISNEICQIVFTLPNLKVLTFNVSSLPTEKSFYCCMMPLEKITKLRLVGKFPKHEIGKLFMANFPNVITLNLKHLKCSVWFMKFMHKISDSQKNIQHLKISNFFAGASPNLHFKNLKSLFVYNSQNIAVWKNFILTHSSTIEEIIVDKIHEEGKFKPNDILDILDLPKIRKLSIRGDRKSIDEIYSVIKSDYKQLREVNLRIFISKNYSLSIDKKIIFPCDKKFWWPQKCDKFINEE